ncbi:MAG: hypothetical protein ACKVE4_04945 [Dissulfuribacterales bacterium]
MKELGLLKLDLLGLRELTVIHDTLALIKSQGQTPPDISHFDMTDKTTFQLLCSGDTTGVFQLESLGRIAYQFLEVRRQRG